METQLGNETYQIGRLDVFTQLNIARKLGPAMPLVDGLVRTENAEKDLSILTLMALSQISDDANEYVLTKCLTAVSIKQDKGWAKVTSSTGVLMFDTMTMEQILKLTVLVIEENLGDFFRTALGNLDRAETDKQAT